MTQPFDQEAAQAWADATGHPDAAGMPGDRLDDTASVQLHEERLQVGTRVIESGRLKVRTRIVTEERQITVQVRRHEIEVVEEDGTGAVDGSAFDAAPAAEDIVLWTEEPVVTMQVRPYQRVSFVREVTQHDVEATETVRREHAEVVDDTGRLKGDLRD